MEQTIQFDQTQQEYQEEIPWVVFRLKQTYYAIYSVNIQGIMVLPQGVTPLPNMRNVFRGIVWQRGLLTALLDLRLLFGMDSSLEQMENFSAMIEQRKQDHIRWVRELRRCFEAGEKFTLTTNPHGCAFGKWYDSFVSDSLSMTHQMKKIDGPHQTLHRSADNILSDAVPKEERTQKMEQLEAVLMPQILNILDESVRLFRAIHHGMLIVLAEGDKRVGLVVDEVLSVERLELISDMSSCQFPTEYIKKIAKSSHLEREILTVDDQRLLNEASNVSYA